MGSVPYSAAYRARWSFHRCHKMGLFFSLVVFSTAIADTSSKVNPDNVYSSVDFRISSTGILGFLGRKHGCRPPWMVTIAFPNGNSTFWWRDEGTAPKLWIRGLPRIRLLLAGTSKTFHSNVAVAQLLLAVWRYPSLHLLNCHILG